MAELEGLDEAWFATFGEMLTEDAGGGGSQRSTEQTTVPEPLDDDVLGWKSAARLAGVYHSTLRREVLAKAEAHQ